MCSLLCFAGKRAELVAILPRNHGCTPNGSHLKRERACLILFSSDFLDVQGRQRCFTHREPGMVHVLVASPEEDSSEDDAVAPNC